MNVPVIFYELHSLPGIENHGHVLRVRDSKDSNTVFKMLFERSTFGWLLQIKLSASIQYISV